MLICVVYIYIYMFLFMYSYIFILTYLLCIIKLSIVHPLMYLFILGGTHNTGCFLSFWFPCDKKNKEYPEPKDHPNGQSLRLANMDVAIQRVSQMGLRVDFVNRPVSLRLCQSNLQAKFSDPSQSSLGGQ